MSLGFPVQPPSETSTLTQDHPYISGKNAEGRQVVGALPVSKTLADLQSDLEMNHHAGEAPPEWHRCEFLLRAARDGYLQEVSWW